MACNPRGRDSHGAISNASGRELLENSLWYDCRGREIISVHCKSEQTYRSCCDATRQSEHGSIPHLGNKYNAWTQQQLVQNAKSRAVAAEC